MKNILELNNKQAKNFFLKQESYFSNDLPRYFIFEKLLKDLDGKFAGKPIAEFIKKDEVKQKHNFYPSNEEGVNYHFLQNKDGRFSWRPLQLIHPALYVSLVDNITQPDNWGFITKRFEDFKKHSKVSCFSIPLVSNSKLSDKATNISNWFASIEQKSIELAMRFDYVLHTDISDCYGSIYTHSIPWALHTKATAKTKKQDKALIGNVIDKHLQDMSYGQTNGIPQGSVLMDFIAEMVLGCADLQLNKRIASEDIKDFRIIRYRDDYRIFTNNPQIAELILKHLTEILIGLGLRLNPHKTFYSSNVVEDSIKPDKLYWIVNKRKNKNLQEHLLLIHQLSKSYPNSGSLMKALDTFFSRIIKLKPLNQQKSVMISLVVDIAYKNPRAYPICAAILSKLFSLLGPVERKRKIGLIKRKFSKLPNTGHLEVWLQRSILKFEKKISFQEKLCQKLEDSSVVLWNSKWLESNIEKFINEYLIIDEKILGEMDAVLSKDEVQLFNQSSNYGY